MLWQIPPRCCQHSKKKGPFYSVFKILAGLDIAAFAEWNDAVAVAVITITIADNTKGINDKPVLNGKMRSHLFIKYQATGNAIAAAIRANHK
jgi:hypothetical protein